MRNVENHGVTKVAISQSNYIPWKGYFDMIASVDHFVLYDDVQFTRRDWRNRNKIKTPQGLAWVTVPVRSKGKYVQPIKSVEIEGDGWADKHWKTIVANYSRASHFKDVETLLAPLYLDRTYTYLSELNATFLRAICEYLGIDTPILDSSTFTLRDGTSERLIGICETLGASVYVSGPAARNYLDAPLFNEAALVVDWFDYEGYPSYDQLWGNFEHGVSVVDLVANTGPNAAKYMKYL